MSTPSHRRRRGRLDYEPGVDPMDVQPYKKGTRGFDVHLPDYLEGWYEMAHLEGRYEMGDESPRSEEELWEERCPCCGRPLPE
jgi:hypothetical protein